MAAQAPATPRWQPPRANTPPTRKFASPASSKVKLEEFYSPEAVSPDPSISSDSSDITDQPGEDRSPGPPPTSPIPEGYTRSHSPAIKTESPRVGSPYAPPTFGPAEQGGGGGGGHGGNDSAETLKLHLIHALERIKKLEEIRDAALPAVTLLRERHATLQMQHDGVCKENRELHEETRELQERYTHSYLNKVERLKESEERVQAEKLYWKRQAEAAAKKAGETETEKAYWKQKAEAAVMCTERLQEVADKEAKRMEGTIVALRVRPLNQVSRAVRLSRAGWTAAQTSFVPFPPPPVPTTPRRPFPPTPTPARDQCR